MNTIPILIKDKIKFVTELPFGESKENPKNVYLLFVYLLIGESLNV